MIITYTIIMTPRIFIFQRTTITVVHKRKRVYKSSRPNVKNNYKNNHRHTHTHTDHHIAKKLKPTKIYKNNFHVIKISWQKHEIDFKQDYFAHPATKRQHQQMIQIEINPNFFNRQPHNTIRYDTSFHSKIESDQLITNNYHTMSI